MTTPLDQQCLELHQCYIQMTGLPISYIGCHYVWADFVRRGLNLQDLKNWLNDLKYRISRGQLDHRSLRFTNAISNIQRCEEGCIELRRKARGHAPDTDKSSVLRSTGRTESANSDSAKSVADVIHAVAQTPEQFQAAMERFKQENRSLGL